MNGELNYNLSKSKYCAAVQCPKMLWLKEYKSEVVLEDTVDQEVLDAASSLINLAKRRVLDGEHKVVTEEFFSAEGLSCSVDIVKYLSEKEVELYEVKSSTSVQEWWNDGAAFQYYVLTKAGYRVKSYQVIYINNKYVRHSKLNYRLLFNLVDITDKVLAKQGEVEENINNICEYLKQTEEPLKDIGEHCFTPHDCEAWGYCTKHLPQPSVFDVAGAKRETKLECYYNGLTSFADLIAIDEFSDSQRKQIEHELYDYPPEIDVENIRKFLAELSYPIYFLDFEAFQPAVPLFKETKPYEQIIFQYSLHYLEEEGGELKHKEFLAYPGSDPRCALAEQLCQDIPRDVCVTAYNKGFEKGKIRGLAELYPDLSEHLMNIHDHIQDLMVPFQKKWYYCKAMQGSYSIKYVLPALFPDDPTLDYHNLEGVSNGREASETFERMSKMSAEEIELVRQQLLKYCGLDTFAMVKVWEKLKEVCERGV